jgi:hypothetical protein
MADLIGRGKGNQPLECTPICRVKPTNLMLMLVLEEVQVASLEALMYHLFFPRKFPFRLLPIEALCVS